MVDPVNIGGAILTSYKTWHGKTDTDKDDELTRLLCAVFDLAENYTSMRLTAVAAESDTWVGEGETMHITNWGPVVAITSIVVDGGTAIPLSANTDASGYYIVGNIIRLRGYDFTAGAVCVVTYTAGYAVDSTPREMVQACIEQAAWWNETPQHIGRKSSTLGQENISYSEDALLPTVKAVFDRYRRRLL